MCDGLKMPISISFIDKAIKELKTNKSSGLDLLLNEEFFIHRKNTLLSYLCTLFNKVFNSGNFPQSWSEGSVIPLHKKGSVNDENNYRGITMHTW